MNKNSGTWMCVPLEMKCGPLIMILKANDKVCNGYSQYPKDPRNSHVEITYEDNAYHFLLYQGYYIILKSYHKARHSAKLIMWKC